MAAWRMPVVIDNSFTRWSSWGFKRLYTVNLQVAHAAWQIGNNASALGLLEELRPRDDEADLRGFEWHLLRKLCPGMDRH